ncbi:MAG TPA: hypothetical protein V6D25_20405 [Leptolyngbyaceae cyanobacterium]
MKIFCIKIGCLRCDKLAPLEAMGYAPLEAIAQSHRQNRIN